MDDKESTCGVRTKPATTNIIKLFDESFRVVRYRFRQPAIHELRYTMDYPTIRWAAQRLAERTESRKIMFILTDGGTWTDNDVLDRAMVEANKKLVKAMENAGIEVIGFAVQSDAMKAYCPRYISINDLNELPTKFYGELSKLLLRR